MNRRSMISSVAAAVVVLSVPHQAAAATPRATLVTAAFETSGKSRALALVNSAIGTLNATLAKDAGDRDAQLQRGIAYGYRGKLTSSIGDARKARDLLTKFVQSHPSDPEGQVALGGWHLTVLSSVGSLVGGTLGASKSKGIAALDRAVKLGGNRAFFPAYAGLSRIALSSSEAAAAKALLEKADGGAAPSEVDRITRSAARQVLALLNKGKSKEASQLAQDLLPFGRVS